MSPQGLESGQANWYVTRQFGGTGRVLQSNRAQNSARSFSCGEHSVIIGADFYPNDTNESVGQTNDFGEVEAQFGLTEDSGGYSGDYVGDGGADYYNWESFNTSIATISGSADGSSVSVEGMSPGTASIEGNVEDDEYPDLCEAGTEGSMTVTGDQTPVITGIDPDVWSSSASAPTTTPNVTFTGQYFGTNAPTLSFSPSTGISYSLSSYSDTQIVANITVAAGTPTEDVSVSVTNNGYGGNNFNSAGSGEPATSSQVYAHVQAPMNSPDVTVIGWIDGSQITLPTNESLALDVALNSTQTACLAEEGLWAINQIGAATGPNDPAYANAWLLKNSANSTPPSTITPSIQSILFTTYRLFNDFGGSSSVGAWVGWTLDPCGTLAALPGQSYASNGYSNVSGAGNTYQLAEGRIGPVGQAVYATLNNQQSVPWIWSVVEFNSSGASVNITSPANYQIFPTYYVYVNGVLNPNYTITQSSVSTITGSAYQNSQLTPSQIQ
jgi:hypothetical protein